MTRSGQRFVSAMSFQSLSGHAVATSLWAETAEASEDAGTRDDHGMAHIDLSQWAQLQVAAPASADLIARLALGLADDVVTATALACPAPLLMVPAMETAMWRHEATQAHVRTLRGRGARVLPPVAGRLASGRQGEGRMAEPSDVVAAAVRMLADHAPGTRWLAGRRVVVTAGGTREPVDPVRFLGNRSSGKMGNALALEACLLGAEVTLITAAAPPPPEPGLTVVGVETAAEMLDQVRAGVAGADVLVMAAAVADYRPLSASRAKLKKGDGPLTLELVPTTDVLRALAEDGATRGVVVVGFAAETDNLEANARHKLEAKRLNLIVANDVSGNGTAMGSDDNAVVIIGPAGVVARVDRAPKPDVARAILEAVRPLLDAGSR
jgi:phosphopantothenoylcysteine decarboxylase/phosphopantothenate--cysteine ligase